MKPKIYSIYPKILHIRQNLSTKNVSLSYNFFNVKMDFYLRKVLKANNIGYQFDRKRKMLLINEIDSPFRLSFKFDEFGYTIVNRIPPNEFELHILAPTVEELINKMVYFKILSPMLRKKLIVPINYHAQQLKLFKSLAAV